MLSALAVIAALSPFALAAPVETRGGSRFTYYDTSVGLGSCGVLHQNSEYTVALNSNDMAAYGSSYPSPACGKSIWVSYGGKTVSATIQDECPSCGSGELDLSEGLFSALADQSAGVIYGSWGYNGNGAAAATTTKEHKTTTTAPAWTPEPTTTTPAWTPEPTTTTPAWVAPTTTEAAWTPATTTTAAHTTTTAAAAVHTSVVESSSAPAAASTSATKSWESWASVEAPVMCPNSTLVLFNHTEVLFNGSYTPQVNGTGSLLANVSAMVINSLLPNATSFCFNSTFSPYNASSFNLTSALNETTGANSSAIFQILAAVPRS